MNWSATRSRTPSEAVAQSGSSSDDRGSVRMPTSNASMRRYVVRKSARIVAAIIQKRFTRDSPDG